MPEYSQRLIRFDMGLKVYHHDILRIPATGGEGLRVLGGSFVRSLWQADA